MTTKIELTYCGMSGEGAPVDLSPLRGVLTIIETLRAENQRLREALQTIVGFQMKPDSRPGPQAKYSPKVGEFEALGEVKTILQKACDRSWADETLYQTANIVSNAIYWRNKEIERLKARVTALEYGMAKIDTLGNGLSMQEDEQGLTSYATLMRCGSVARASLAASGGAK